MRRCPGKTGFFGIQQAFIEVPLQPSADVSGAFGIVRATLPQV
jgi:hypothetical protein